MPGCASLRQARFIDFVAKPRAREGLLTVVPQVVVQSICASTAIYRLTVNTGLDRTHFLELYRAMTALLAVLRLSCITPAHHAIMSCRSVWLA
ncbi:MAG: hypothetical protein ACUVSY_04310 [Roseiflexus sp.]